MRETTMMSETSLKLARNSALMKLVSQSSDGINCQLSDVVILQSCQLCVYVCVCVSHYSTVYVSQCCEQNAVEPAGQDVGW